MNKNRFFLALLLSVFLPGCATSPPKNPNNICSIFREQDDWYEAAQDANQRWGTPIQVMMAIMHQESRFVSDAQPPRTWYLGFIPGPRPSSAYGYAQAQTPAWDDYLKEAGSWGADRDDFADAIDFIGWYTWKTHQVNGVSKWHADKLYLNYHEGWGGYRRGTYKSKPWLTRVAAKVKRRASDYGAQLRRCEDDLDSWFF
ncbi:hypothetical protein MIB92_07815 [Aestuariirhabdus sp. Z084]|uniref:transglycosylase SLT domain-containing protein n=1 Tax=Aestuariirhabdus haliotis TaxID=2918751 RepID=UPI00201B444C|nr:hypothetical protein [Aestuariirhabdus haliotis]MCL6415552.1 hypothetical protein [Aestuariirhabdus haliotis]MCL6419243.1 hypothetical protein [Aestuariirhabdus haliotis]